MLVLVLPLAGAQSNDFLDSILASSAVSPGQAALLLALASEQDPPPADEAAAQAMALEKWLPGGFASAKTVRTDEYALLVMKAFGMTGGLMYGLFPGPRYAFRELTYRRLILGRPIPESAVSGQAALRILGAVLAEREARQ